MKEKIALIYKILIVIVSAVALYLNFKLYSFRQGILYFTNLSNLLCFVFFLSVVVLTLTKKLKKTNTYYILKGMVTMSITVTMFVYQLLLSSSNGMGAFEGHMLECNLVHLIVPLMVIFDYIVFSSKGNLKKEYPFIWSFVLIAYQLFVVIYGLWGGTFMDGSKYPYFYMDIDTYGITGVVLNCLIVYVFFVGYGSIVQMIDNKLKNKQKK